MNIVVTVTNIVSVSVKNIVEIFKCFFENPRDPQKDKEIDTHVCCEHYKDEVHRQIKEEYHRLDKRINIP